MYSLFAFFIPSIIGVRINNYFNKELKIKNIIYNYITLLLFSFIINVLIMYNLFGIKENVFNVINSDTILFAEMAAISIIVNVILVFIGLVIQKNVMFKIEVENETKIIQVQWEWCYEINQENNKQDTEDAKKLKRHIEIEFEIHKNRQIYWDDVALFCYPEEYQLGIMEMNQDDIIEVDNFEELVQLDQSYLKGGI